LSDVVAVSVTSNSSLLKRLIGHHEGIVCAADEFLQVVLMGLVDVIGQK
jgi:hypothetical protein